MSLDVFIVGSNIAFRFDRSFRPYLGLLTYILDIKQTSLDVLNSIFNIRSYFRSLKIRSKAAAPNPRHNVDL
jgi:hypothetical protein